MWLMKYLLAVLTVLFSLAGDWLVNLKWIKWLKWGFAVLLLAIQIYVMVSDDRGADRERSEQSERHKEQLRQGEVTRRVLEEKLNVATGQVERLQIALKNANDNLDAQNRRMASLLFNMKTSPEGKERFAQCMASLSYVDSRDDYRTLLCDDGAAVYLFSKTNGEMSAFYFYSNSDINEVLSGLRIGPEIKDNEGQYVFSDKSETALALSCALDRKSPRYGSDEVSHRLALNCVVEKFRQFFVHVFRLDPCECELAQNDTLFADSIAKEGDLLISGFYKANPAREGAANWPIRLKVDSQQVVSLCGKTMRELSQNILRICKERNLNPKIRIRDIDLMSKRQANADAADRFPFSYERMLRMSR